MTGKGCWVAMMLARSGSSLLPEAHCTSDHSICRNSDSSNHPELSPSEGCVGGVGVAWLADRDALVEFLVEALAEDLVEPAPAKAARRPPRVRRPLGILYQVEGPVDSVV